MQPDHVYLDVVFYKQGEVKEEIASEDVKEGKSEEELAKQLAKPIAALISVPFQFNYDRGFANTSGNESNKWTLNVQPVIPFTLNDDWNLISRTDDMRSHGSVSDLKESLYKTAEDDQFIKNDENK